MSTNQTGYNTLHLVQTIPQEQSSISVGWLVPEKILAKVRSKI